MTALISQPLTSQLSTPDEKDDPRIALHDAALASYEDEQADLADANKLLETKAQATIATAGVFLAAVLALTRDRLAHAPSIVLALIIFTIALLAAAVVAAAGALQVRTSLKPPRGACVADVTDALAMVVDERDFRDRLTCFRQDQIRLWRDYSVDRHRVHESKATLLSRAQGILVAGVMLAAALAIGAVFYS